MTAVETLTTTTTENADTTELLDIETVAAIVGVNPRTVRRWAEQRLFPAPIRVGPRILRWRRADVRNYLANKGTIHQ